MYSPSLVAHFVEKLNACAARPTETENYLRAELELQVLSERKTRAQSTK